VGVEALGVSAICCFVFPFRLSIEGQSGGFPYKADAVPLRTTRTDLHTTTVISMDAGGMGVA